MGECACGDLSAREGYEVGGNVLVVEIYPGCVGCETGIQVSVHLLTPAAAKEHDIEIKGALSTGAHGWGRLTFPVLGADDLMRAAARLEGEGAGFDDIGALANLLPSKITRLLQEGVAEARRKAAAGGAGEAEGSS